MKNVKRNSLPKFSILHLYKLPIIGLACLFLAACVHNPAYFSGKNRPKSHDYSELAILDSNRDGFLDPYEALDLLFAAQKEIGEPLPLERLREYARANFQNGEWEDNAESPFMSEAEIQDELDLLFAELGAERDGLIKPDALMQEDADSWDLDRDGFLTRPEIRAFLTANNSPARFEVEGNTAYMSGVIWVSTPARVLRLLFEHPEVDTIEMRIVPGSADDESNLRAAAYVRAYGLATRLNAQSYIASGGTDFFLAGKRRIIEDGARIGVHSWSSGTGEDGASVAKDDPQHRLYLDYYEEMGIPAEFYWFTLAAAPPYEMYWMNKEEMARYGFFTSPQ